MWVSSISYETHSTINGAIFLAERGRFVSHLHLIPFINEGDGGEGDWEMIVKKMGVNIKCGLPHEYSGEKSISAQQWVSMGFFHT